MRRITTAAAVAVAVAATGCGGQRLTAGQRQQASKAESQVQKVVQSCVGKGSFITHDGRQEIIRCIFPPGAQQAGEKCMTSSIARDGFLTKRDRAALGADLAKCAETYR